MGQGENAGRERAASGAFAGLRPAFAQLASLIVRHRKQRADLMALNDLNDRMLRDIGLQRIDAWRMGPRPPL